MQGIGHPFLRHFGDKPPVGLGHNKGIGCLKGDNDLVEFPVAAHFEPLHGGIGHALGGVAVKIGDTLAKGAVVYSDSDCSTAVAAHLHEFAELGRGHFRVFVEISRIYPYLLDKRGHLDCGLGRKMYIGDKRDSVALILDSFSYVLYILDVCNRRTGDPDKACSGLKEPYALLRSSLHVGGMRVTHRLNEDSAAAPDGEGADPD